MASALRFRIGLGPGARLGGCPGAARLAPRRHASSTSPGSSSALASRSGSGSAVLYGGLLAASVCAAALYATDTRASAHRWLVPRLLRVAFPDAEDAHHAGTAAMQLLYRLGLHVRERGAASPALQTTVLGAPLDNPLGISAGLDKDAEVADALFALGAAVVEVGGITPRAQAGNPRPRVFRVPAIDGLVNRYGLNSQGADAVARRLRDRVRRFARRAGLDEAAVLAGEAGVPPGSLQAGRLLAVQVAKNKETDEGDEAAVAADYVYCVRRLARYADVLVVNVSSPNTPGLRDLQATGPLTRLLGAVVEEAARSSGPRAQRARVMVKVSPDEDGEAQVAGIVQAAQASGVDGIIVGNTTKRRAGLAAGARLTAAERAALGETGGFSGPATFERTRALVARYRAQLDAAAAAAGEAAPKAIFATGGITSGAQALRVLDAGASVAMVYTGLVYGGAGTVTRMKREMEEGMRGR